jgi:hypothetical protein
MGREGTGEHEGWSAVARLESLEVDGSAFLLEGFSVVGAI